MKRLLATFTIALVLFAQAQTFDLATLNTTYTAQDGDVVTGTSPLWYSSGTQKYHTGHIKIADGATVTLRDATIDGNTDTQFASWAGIECLGDATIILEGENIIQGGCGGAGIQSCNGHTLTIKGSGSLVAKGSYDKYGGGAGISSEGNIVIKSGTVSAVGSKYAAGIGSCHYYSGYTGNIIIMGGTITATGDSGAAGIGSGYGGGCGDITITGGNVSATGSRGVGASVNCYDSGYWYYTSCGNITIEDTVIQVLAKATAWRYDDNDEKCYYYPIDSGEGSAVMISDALSRTIEENFDKYGYKTGETLTLIPSERKHTITWLNEDGTVIDTTIAEEGAMPVHAAPTKTTEIPYVYSFAGWSPALALVSSNATYTATFSKVADLSLVTGDWTAADGDIITNTTAHAVTIPAGASVTVNGMTLRGANISGSPAVPAPEFSEVGKATTTEFTQDADGKWTLTTFAELSNDALGSGVADGQIKVYAASTLEGLNTVSPMASGVEIKEKKSAVKTTIKVTPPNPSASTQFFKVKFGSSGNVAGCQ